MEVFNQAVHEVRAFLASEREEAVEEWIGGHGDRRMEKPIEAAFLLWWMAFDLANDGADRLRLVPQHEVEIVNGQGRETQRVDFVVEPASPVFVSLMEWCGRSFKVAIQLDGVEARASLGSLSERRQRDKALEDDGWTVYRVSGSELFRDGENCIQDVYMSAIEQLLRLQDCLIREVTAASRRDRRGGA